MKTYHQLLCATMLALFVAGCSSDHTDEVPEPESKKIPITLSCGITATSTKATDTGFETGDKIGLYVVNYSGEAKDPTRDIPFVIIVSTGAIVVLYALMSTIAAGVLMALFG